MSKGIPDPPNNVERSCELGREQSKAIADVDLRTETRQRRVTIEKVIGAGWRWNKVPIKKLVKERIEFGGTEYNGRSIVLVLKLINEFLK
jgi:hypothetical protein